MFCSLLLILSATTAKRINRGPRSVPDTHDRDIIIIKTLLFRTDLIFYCINAIDMVFGFHRKSSAWFVLEKRSVAAGIRKNNKIYFKGDKSLR